MTEPYPRVSIIIPAWNRSDGLRRSVQSVLDQSHEDFEILVIDDGSDDDTPDVVDQLGDPRVRLARTAHGGVSAARNRGAGLAHGSALIFLDCDDLVLPGWIEALSRPILAGLHDLSLSGWHMIDSDGNERSWVPDSLGTNPDAVAPHFLAGAWAISRSLFETIGGFDESISYGECTELALRILLGPVPPRIQTVNRPLHIHRRKAGVSPATQADGARAVLAKHRSQWRSYPRLWASYNTLVGVDDARKGRRASAVRHLLAAMLADPFAPSREARLLISLIPPLANRVWSHSWRLPAGDPHPPVPRPKEPAAVLLVERYGVRGGAQVVLCDLVENLDRSRFRPIVLCLAPGQMTEELEAAGVTTFVSPIGALRSPAQIVRAARELRAVVARCKVEDVRLVHINQLGGRLPVLFGSAVAKLLGTPAVWHIHDPPDDTQSLESRVFLWLVAHLQPKWTIFASPHSMQGYVTRFRSDDRHSLVLPGIATPDADVAGEASARTRFQIPEGVPLVAMVGRLTERKAQHHLVQALGILAQRDCRVFAILCGGLGPPEYRDRLTQLATEMDVDDRLVFAGYTDERLKATVIASCDIYVHTAIFEPLGLALLEAMAAGKPVIAADAPGPSFIVEPDVNGVLYERGNPHALASAVEAMILQPEERHRLGDAARTRAAAFSIGKMVDSVQTIWSRVLEGIADEQRGAPGMHERGSSPEISP